MKNINDYNINSEAKDIFFELIKNKRLPHAVLLDGANEETAYSFALYLASCFVCEGNIPPCGECQNCLKIFSNCHPDVITIDPIAHNEKTFKIEFVRTINSDVHVLPNEASKKVYILNASDKMNIQAQNALLKTIEEPPEYARFILICESRSSMLETILSRVSAFNISKINDETSDEIIQKAKKLAKEFCTALLAPTELNFLRLSSEFEKDKDIFDKVLLQMQLIFRDAVALKNNSSIIVSDYRDTAEKLMTKITVKNLVQLISCCNNLYENNKNNANKNLLYTRFCSLLRQAAYGN